MDACTVMKREKRHNASGISNEGMQFLAMSWPILQTSVTFPAHASIGMYGIKLIFECHISEKAGSKGLQDSNDG